jgi:predicted ATPase with chaperone activity
MSLYRGRCVGVRVWGAVGDRLIEVRASPAPVEDGFLIAGLPRGTGRTTADRVRAAIVNSGVAAEGPSSVVRLEPCVGEGPTAFLDLPVALAALASTGVIGDGIGWIYAEGRLGMDGSVFGADGERSGSLDDAVGSCQTPLLGFEHQFERENE